MNNEKIIQAIVKQGILPLYYHPDEAVTLEVMQVLYDCGLRVVEYTNRGKQALKNFRSLKKATYKQFPELVLGMGTITDIKTAEKAIQNGADFLVSPGYSKEMSKFISDENMLWIPGCFTASELMQSVQAGIEMVKIFPASVAGPGFMRSVKEVFLDLLFLPTGGINTENMQEWFRAGASAVGIGSSLISKEILEQKNFDLLKSKTMEAMRQVAMREQM